MLTIHLFFTVETTLYVVDYGSHYINGVLNAELPATIGDFIDTKSIQEVFKGKEGDRCSDVISFVVALVGGDAIRI